MHSFIRLYLGSKWRPDWAELEYARDPEAAVLEERLQIPLRFEQLGSGVALKRDDLNRRRGFKATDGCRIVTLRDVRADAVLANAPEPARALSTVVALRLLVGQSDIDGAARLSGWASNACNAGFGGRAILITRSLRKPGAPERSGCL